MKRYILTKQRRYFDAGEIAIWYIVDTHKPSWENIIWSTYESWIGQGIDVQRNKEVADFTEETDDIQECMKKHFVDFL